MGRYVGTRVLELLPVLLLVSIVAFLLLHLVPGDPARIMLGTRATPAAVADLRAQLGLDRSLPVQYWDFLRNAVTFDFGTSIRARTSVSELIGRRARPEPAAGRLHADRRPADRDPGRHAGRRQAGHAGSTRGSASARRSRWRCRRSGSGCCWSALQPAAGLAADLRLRRRLRWARREPDAAGDHRRDVPLDAADPPAAHERDRDAAERVRRGGARPRPRRAPRDGQAT